MIERELSVTNTAGLHARAATRLTASADRFRSEISLHRNGEQANGKELSEVLMLAVPRNGKVTLRVHGEDQEEAVRTLVALFESRFGESS